MKFKDSLLRVITHSKHFYIIIASVCVSIFFLEINATIFWGIIVITLSAYILFNTELQLYLFVFSLPYIGVGVLKSVFDISIGTGIQPSFVFAGLLFVTLIFKLLISGFTIIIPKSKVNLILLLFLFVVIMSLGMSFFIPYSEFRGEIPFIKSIKQIVQLSLMILVYFLLIIYLNTETKIYKVFNVLLFTGLIASVYGLYQFIGYYLGLPGTNLFNSNVGFATAENSKLFLGSSFTDLLRIRATAPEPAMFGNFLLCVIPIQTSLVLSKYSIKKRNYVYLLIMLVAFLLTFSKGAFLALFVSLLIVIKYINQNQDYKRMLFKLFLIILFIALVFSGLISFFLNTSLLSAIGFIGDRMYQIINPNDISNLTRLSSYIAAIKMILYFPIFGVGFGNFGFYYFQFSPSLNIPEHFYWPVSNNIYLNVFSELGLIGIILFMLIIIFLLRESKSLINLTKNDIYWHTISIGLFASLIGILIQFFTISSFNYPHVWFIIASIISIRTVYLNSQTV